MNPDTALLLLEFARDHKISRSALQLLLIVSKAQVLTMSTAAARMNFTYQALYYPIDRLHNAGLLKIHRCPHDQHVSGLSLTEKARHEISLVFHPSTAAA